MLYDKKWDVDVVDKTLLAVADYIEQHGWCQHKARIEGRVCVMGAMGRIVSSDNVDVYAALNRLRRKVGGCIVDWNDAPDQTKENIIETIRQVALC